MVVSEQRPRSILRRAVSFRSPFRKPKEFGHSTRWVIETIRNAGANCPRCTHGRLVLEENGEQRSLTCTQCEFRAGIEAQITRIASNLDVLQRREAKTFNYAIGFFVAIVTISAINHNILTFIGGCILTLVVMMQALAARYRVWQVMNRRLFERRAPFGDWIRAELGRSVTTR